MKHYPQSILQPQKYITSIDFINQIYIQETLYLIKRLFKQTLRRPSSLFASIIQPLLWLILFGGLFQNIPTNLFTVDKKYGQFLSCGIIIFTAFTGSLNSGLPLIFDREFGFLNRLLAAPLISKNSIVLSSTYFIICTTIIQILAILLFSIYILQYKIYAFHLFIAIVLLITTTIANISLGLAFILPGHIEFLAFTFITNLPMLFSSTALAPLSFMPFWLQILAHINPLTYGIESLRSLSTTYYSIYLYREIDSLWLNISIAKIIVLLSILSFISFLSIKNIIISKLE